MACRPDSDLLLRVELQMSYSKPCAVVNPRVQHCFAWLDKLVAGRLGKKSIPFSVGYTTGV